MSYPVLPAIVLVLALTGCAPPTSSTETPPVLPGGASLKIRTGTYFGMCLGYCVTEVSIAPRKGASASDLGATAVVTRASNLRDDPDYPILVDEVPMADDVWASLVRETEEHLDAFFALDETLGCPDCADGGGEWVALSVDERTNRVDFEFGASIPEIDGLLERIREVRSDLVDRVES